MATRRVHDARKRRARWKTANRIFGRSGRKNRPELTGARQNQPSGHSWKSPLRIALFVSGNGPLSLSSGAAFLSSVTSSVFVIRDIDTTRILCAMFGKSEEHTSELQSLMRISYAVFCLQKKKKQISEISY